MSGGGHGTSGPPGLDDEHEEHEEHVNHEAWVIPYADLLTLLMALFIILFAVSSVDAQKFEKLKNSFNSAAAGGGSPFEKGDGLLPGDTSITEEKIRAYDAIVAADRSGARHAAVEAAVLDGIERRVLDQARIDGLAGKVVTRTDARGLLITVVADDVLFEPGSAGLRTAGTGVLGEIADALRSLPNDLVIEGHTDARPISTAQFPSNWELSTARATAVLRFFVESHRIPAERTSASGYGAERPVGDNSTAEGRSKNRRVEILVVNRLAPSPSSSAAPGDDSSASPPSPHVAPPPVKVGPGGH